jgi:hypothetical protein
MVDGGEEMTQRFRMWLWCLVLLLVVNYSIGRWFGPRVVGWEHSRWFISLCIRPIARAFYA